MTPSAVPRPKYLVIILSFTSVHYLIPKVLRTVCTVHEDELVLQAASPRRTAAAAQLSQRVLLLIPGRQFELLISPFHVVLRPLHVGLDVFDVGSLFLHQHKNVHEQVSQLPHVVFQTQQLLSVDEDQGINIVDVWDISQRLKVLRGDSCRI